jgi:uncharacterized OsmC-like protein
MLTRTIDVDLLRQTAEAMRAEPRMAAATIRTRHASHGGAAVEGRCELIEGLGERLPRAHPLRADWPEPFGGGDAGPTSGETLMGALGACVAQTYAVRAAMRGVAVDGLDVSVEGGVDLRGAYDLDGVPAAFSRIDVTVDVRADADEAVLQELADATRRTSPVFDTLANAVPLTLAVRRAV